MRKTLLLADHSATIRKIVELTFAESDVRVEAVASAAEALERMQTALPDVVLADVALPEPGGYDLCRTIKTSPRPVPVLLLAGAFEPLDEERARRVGADGHLVKPFESATLVRKIEALLASPPLPAQEPVAVVQPAEPAVAPAAPVAPIPPEQLHALAREVAALISADVVREVAREVVPEVAERVVRERIRELESDGS